MKAQFLWITMPVVSLLLTGCRNHTCYARPNYRSTDADGNADAGTHRHTDLDPHTIANRDSGAHIHQHPAWPQSLELGGQSGRGLGGWQLWGEP